MCLLEFQAASAARSELSSLPISLSLTLALSFPPTILLLKLAPKIKQTMNFCVSWRKSLNFFCACRKRDRGKGERETEREREESDLTRSYWNCSVLNCKLVLCWANSLRSTVKCSSNNNGNHFPYKMQQQINSDNNNNSKKRASQQKRRRERESCNDEMSKQ